MPFVYSGYKISLLLSKKEMRLFFKYWRKKLLPLFAVALAGLYIGSFLLTDLVHPFVHQQENATHTAADELDPCHLEIYHGVKETSASHHTHLSRSSDKCWLCDIVFHYDQLHHELPLLKKAGAPFALKLFPAQSTSFGYIALVLSRGPPSLA